MYAVVRHLLKGDHSQISRRYQSQGLQRGERFAEDLQHRYRTQRSRKGNATLPFRLKRQTCVQIWYDRPASESVARKFIVTSGRNRMDRRRVIAMGLAAAGTGIASPIGAQSAGKSKGRAIITTETLKGAEAIHAVEIGRAHV